MRLLRPSPLLAFVALLSGGAMLWNPPTKALAFRTPEAIRTTCTLMVTTADQTPIANQVLVLRHAESDQRLELVTDSKGCIRESLEVGTWDIAAWTAPDGSSASIEIAAGRESPYVVALP